MVGSAGITRYVPTILQEVPRSFLGAKQPSGDSQGALRWHGAEIPYFVAANTL